MSTSVSIPRPRRWDIPFCQESESPSEMLDADVDRVLGTAPFSELDADGFKKSLPLRDILKNDTRLLCLKEGDIAVRQGDWGNTAFFILSGSVRVEISPPESGLTATMDVGSTFDPPTSTVLSLNSAVIRTPTEMAYPMSSTVVLMMCSTAGRSEVLVTTVFSTPKMIPPSMCVPATTASPK